jgi:N-acetylglucosamine kinase-like BadF-type ATPase
VTGGSRVLLVGVDAGASKSTALAVRPDGAVVGSAAGEGANPKRHGLATAVERIVRLVGQAAGDERPELVYVAGAGLDRPEHARALEGALEDALPHTRVMAANDTLAVLWCGTPDGVGLVVPVSTGGNVTGRGPDGRVTDRGHGIFGGGYVLGALVARAARRGLVTGALRRAVDAAGLTWRGRRPDPTVARLGAAVALAAEASDPFARRLVDRWCRHVAGAVREEAERLRLGAEPVVIVYGGLLDASPWLGGRIADAVRLGAPGARVSTLEAEPVAGAARLARDAWAGRVGPWDFTPRR